MLSVTHERLDMEFLPLLIDGEKVYAGFWCRLGAAIIDMFLWVPIVFLAHKLQSINIPIAVFIVILQAFSFAIYSIYFNLKYGGTIGKLAVGIRITKPNGSRIGAREAILRSSLDLAYGLLFAIFNVYAISKIDATAYLSAASYFERAKLIMPLFPKISRYTELLSNIWYWSEIIVLLLNKRKRALHDYIAGTVVIHNKHA